MLSTVLGTLIIDPPSMLMAGGITALISMKLISRGGLPELWHAAKIAMVFAGLFALSVAWPFFFRSDWMFCYLLDATKLPLAPLYVVFLLVCVGMALVGTLGVGLLLHLGKKGLAWAATVGCAAGWGLSTLATADQYGKVGTTAQYLAGTAPKLPDDSNMFVAVNVITGVLVVGGVVLIVLQIRRTMKGTKPA